MLLKIERTVLRKLSKQPHKASVHISAFPKYSGDEINSAMLTLKEKGYLEIFDKSVDFSSFSYVLSTKGRYYKEYAWRAFLKNILIPFIVALLTTIATLYLEKLVENDDSANTSGYTCDYGNDN